MVTPGHPSSRLKWAILTLVSVIVILSLVIAYLTGALFQSRFSASKSERIIFGSCEWEAQSAGIATSAQLEIANVGADDVVIDRAWINQTLLDSSEWLCLPSIRLKPGDQGVLHVTPASSTFRKGSTCKFTLETTARNIFSTTDLVVGGWEIQQAGVILVKENIAWPTSTTVEVTIRNAGTGNAKIVSAYSGTDSNNLAFMYNVDPTLPQNVNAGESTKLTLTLSSSWTANTMYYFKFATDTPVVLEFVQKSP